MKKRTTIYLDVEEYEELQKICVREGTSISEKFGDWQRQYVQLHRQGNPQLMLESFMPSKARPFVLCNMLDGFKEGEVHCTRRGLWVDAKECYGCSRNRLRRKP